MMSMMVSFCAVLFPTGCLEILNLIESVSEGFPSYSYDIVCFKQPVPGKRSMLTDFYRLS